MWAITPTINGFVIIGFERSFNTALEFPPMLFMIICSAPFGKEFENALMDRGIDGYTIIPKVLGYGGSSDPVMDNDTWPGYSVMFLIFVEGKKLEDLKGILKGFSQRVKPFKVFVLKEVDVI